MRPKLRTRILESRFRSGRPSGRGKLAERFDVTHQLPALGFRKLGPDRHTLSNNTICQDPKNRARRGGLNFGGSQVWPLLATSRGAAVTFRAMLFEENGSRSNGVGIILQRIWTVARFFRSFLQFRVDGRIVFSSCRSGSFVRIRALRKDDGHRK